MAIARPMRATRAAALLVAVACVALALAIVAEQHNVRSKRVELTFWDGAAADEPGYAEEAAQQVDTGLYGYHLGYWESPGYWNNRGLADGAESQMDARMFSDAATIGYFQTGGADFTDRDSLYNDATSADSVSLDGTYNDAWPGTGSGLNGYDDIGSENDAYDGQWEVDPLDTEASADASVSGSDVGGFKQVGSRQSQLLAQLKCDRCYSGADCVAGCRTQVGGRAVRRAAKEAGAGAQRAAVAKQGQRVRKQSKAVVAKTTAHKQMALAKKSVKGASEQAPARSYSVFGGLAGINEGLKKFAQEEQVAQKAALREAELRPSPGLMCGRYACAVGGLWGRACGCSLAAEQSARADEEQKADAAYRAEEEHEKELGLEEEEREEWLGLHGIELDASPLAERRMPEQARGFWDSGTKLEKLGFNV